MYMYGKLKPGDLLFFSETDLQKEIYLDIYGIF